MRYEDASVNERRTMPPAVAVSTVGFAIEPPADALIGEAGSTHGGAAARETTLWIPLVRRTREPFSGCWALPGGPTEWHEALADTALRTLSDAVLREPGYLEQLYSFGAVERSAQAQRLVTIAYWAQYGEHDLAATPAPYSHPRPASEMPARWDDPHPSPRARPTAALGRGARASDGATTHAPDPNIAWFPANRLPALAFDHAEIVEYALSRLRIKTEYTAVAHRFLGPEFTLAQLRRVHEAIIAQAVDPANFRRQSLASGHLIETGEFLTGSAHRPAKLYRFTAGSPASSAPDATHATPDHSISTPQGSMQ